MGPRRPLVHCLPVFHAHGLCVGVYGTLLAGASAVLLPGFDPAAVAEAARRRAGHRCSSASPPCTTAWSVRAGPPTSAGLRLCVSGSAPLSAELHAEASAAIGIAGARALRDDRDADERLEPLRRASAGPGTVGFPLPGVEVQLADDGEILVRGPNVFAGYWERPAATAEAFVPAADGGRRWFRTGDLGSDEDGYLVIRGRSKELIITGGFNVYPAEVEDVLAAHPGVAEVAVTGTPSDEWGEVVTAWIVADGAAPTARRAGRLRRRPLAAYKRPRLVHVVDDCPATPWARWSGASSGSDEAIGSDPVGRRGSQRTGAGGAGDGPRHRQAPGRRPAGRTTAGAVPVRRGVRAWWPGSTRWGGGPGPVRCRSGWWCSPPGAGPRRGLRDSKLLTEERREELFPLITRWCADWSVGHAERRECDRLGMTAALRLAARRALDGLAWPPQVVLMDGAFDYVSEPARRTEPSPARRRSARRRSGPWSGATPPACPSPPPPSWPRSPGTG